MAETRYWLFKSNVKFDTFNTLLECENRTKAWAGVRNFQTRKLIRDDIKVGDRILFYHSSAPLLAVVGTARVVREAYPDYFAWDKSSHFYDPQSDPNDPTWLMVDIQAEQEFARPVTLREIKANPKLQGMMVVKRGMRPSIQPVSKEEWDVIVELGMGGLET